LPPQQRARIRIIEGDASAIDMGLSRTELDQLWAELTHIHHCAQITHFGVDRATAEQVNVQGALEAVELATHCGRLQCLVLHSKVSVSGDRVGTVFERQLDEGQGFRNVVEETKARAEKVVRGAMDRLPATVARAATIVGDSVTGEVERFEGLYPFMLLVATSPADLPLPLPARGEELLNLVPVDWVAHAAVAIGRDRRAHGKTFHLSDPNPVTVRGLFDQLAEALGRPPMRGSIPAPLAKMLLSFPGLERIARTPRAFLDLLTTQVTYDRCGAEELLTSLGVPACPAFASYVGKLAACVKRPASWMPVQDESETRVGEAP
jgi:thioester reductase-like protein